MSKPLLTIIIPTYNRPHLLPRAVQSALNQTFENIEVLVVDDASDEPVNLPEHPKLRVIRVEKGVGGAGARNIGTKAARGRWITYLDDDDCLLPHMVADSLSALEKAPTDSPVAVISGLQKVDEQGNILTTRIPPKLCPKGGHFFLEAQASEGSFHTKQTLVVERELVLKIGGWDESFRSRVHSDFFLRLNPECTLIGLPTVTYHLLSHTGHRVSRHQQLRQDSFRQLLKKHHFLFQSHPKMFAEFVYKHALKSYQMGQIQAALFHFLWSLRLCPSHIIPMALKGTFLRRLTSFKVPFWVVSNPY